MDRLSELEAFIRTVELGSQAAAASALKISAVAMSRHIQSLEKRLGITLLERTTRRQILTEAGAAFFDKTRRAMEQIEEAADAAAGFLPGMKGSLRVSAPVCIGERYLTDVLTDFSQKHPEVRVELTLNDRSVDLISDGFDIAIRLGQLPGPNTPSNPITLYRVGLYAAPSYLAKHGTPRAPTDLLSQNCLPFTGTGRIQHWVLIAPDGTRETLPVSGNLIANNASSLMLSSIAGHGIIKQPFFIVEKALKEGLLVPVLPQYRLRELELHIQQPASPPLPKTQAFISCLKDVLARERLNDPSLSFWPGDTA